MRKLTIVVGLGAFPVTIMGDPEIEDEVPRPSRVLEVADNLDVAMLLSPRVTGRDAELCSHLMTGRTEERPKNRDHPAVPWNPGAFSPGPTAWESNPKRQGGMRTRCPTNPSGDLAPTQGGAK